MSFRLLQLRRRREAVSKEIDDSGERSISLWKIFVHFSKHGCLCGPMYGQIPPIPTDLMLSKSAFF